MILEVNQVYKTYRKDCIALKNISFSVEQGEILAIIGESGAGKSTLLRCINRLTDFENGNIVFDGQNIKNANRKNLKKIRSSIGMIFQNYNLVERLSAIENVLHGCLGSIPTYRGAFGFYTKEEKERAFSLLNTVGLEDFAFRRCSELSGGQKQRVGIARSLMQNPKLLLCDEPIASLDPKSAEIVLTYIKKISNEKNISCIINLHQIDLAIQYADRIIALRQGKIVFDNDSKKLTKDVLQQIVFTEQK